VEFIHSLDALRDKPAVTLDGHEITLLGNIEFPSEAAGVFDKGGQGIGLYRTEFLYLGGDTEPSEADHFDAYRQVIDLCGDHPIVVRTLDLGADKYTQSRARTPEPNPFLGCRSIRFCLQNLGMFKTQIRAILRAAVGARLSMLFPLITDLIELRQAKTVVRDVMEDLEEEGIEHTADLAIGMMVETPSAALLAGAFAQEVDFFSIGTNDLVQYTLAVDRGNERVAALFSVAHPSVLQLIKKVIRTGQRHDVPVSVCGEMAGDPMFVLLLLGMGLRIFSCAPPAIPEIKKVIRSVTLDHALGVAHKVMGFHSDIETNNYLRVELRNVLPEASAD
jgi:phosphotransferase system enzyme I (PtsI)